MDGKNDYKPLRVAYMQSLEREDCIKIKRIFDRSKPIELATGKSVEEFSGAEWNQLLKNSVWDRPETASNVRYDVRKYAEFLQEHNVPSTLNTIDETVGQPAGAWSEQFFDSFEEMSNVLASIPFRSGRNNKKALALAMFALGLSADEIAELTTDDMDEDRMQVKTKSRVIKEVEPFIFRFVPLEKGRLIQLNSSRPVTAAAIQNLVYRLDRYQKFEAPHSLVPQFLAKSYLFLKIEQYEEMSGEIIGELSKKAWFFEQCRNWSGIVTNENRFLSLIQEFNRLQKLK